MSASEVPSGSVMPSVAAHALAGNEQPVALGGYFSGARGMISDTRVTLLRVGEARNRTCERLFGVSKQDAGLVTMIGLAMLAHAANRKAHRVLRAFALHRGDAWIAEGVLNRGSTGSPAIRPETSR
jgi:hypothetical protein